MAAAGARRSSPWHLDLELRRKHSSLARPTLLPERRQNEPPHRSLKKAALRLIAKHFLPSTPRNRIHRPNQRRNLIQWSPQEHPRRAAPQPSKRTPIVEYLRSILKKRPVP